MTTPTTPPPPDAALDVAAVAAEAQRLLDAATPGPWKVYERRNGRDVVDAAGNLIADDVGDDAPLIAAAPDLARALVAAAARIAAAEARRDALAAATVEYLDAADADGLGNGEPTVAEYAAAQAARKRLDALLSGAPADVVRAGVVRDFLRAVDAFEAADIAFEMVDDEPDGDEDHDDALAEVDALRTKARDDLAAKRIALDAALAAAEGR